MNVLDLFSGIGGFSLGLERAGMQTVAFCEIEPYCQGVLRKHWPAVPIYEDIRELTADRLRTDGISIDGICGGFPCQDISNAGDRLGIEGERSGLWSEYFRLIRELRPQFIIVENVAALLVRGMGTVLGNLAAGMTQNGNAFRQPPLAPRISETGFGYLPTPDKSLGAFEGFSRGHHGMDANSLFLKETVGERPSGAKIGNSLRWCPEFIREWLRIGGGINPVWLERLMGFPDNWTETVPVETQSFPKS